MGALVQQLESSVGFLRSRLRLAKTEAERRKLQRELDSAEAQLGRALAAHLGMMPTPTPNSTTLLSAVSAEDEK